MDVYGGCEKTMRASDFFLENLWDEQSHIFGGSEKKIRYECETSTCIVVAKKSNIA